MIHARIRMPDGTVLGDPGDTRLAELLGQPGTLAWIDLESPLPAEIEGLGRRLGWEHLTVEDLIRQGQRAKLEHFPGYTLLVMHALCYGPAGESAATRLETPEVDFVVGPNYVVSVHSVALPHITESREVNEHSAALLARGVDYALYVLLDRLVDSYFPALDGMMEAVDELEDLIVSRPQQRLMARIFEMKRDAVVLRRVISPQLELFSQLTAPEYGIATRENLFFYRDVHDHLIRVFESADSYRELMGGALDAYLTTVSNRMNDVVKRLTVIASLFLPMTFVTGLLGMNLRETPPWQDGLFWVVLGIMFGISAAQFVYFVRKRWV
ncbi:MAG: magnesium transporter CorA family protein [Dehalococcoidia bacterium]|nr:magnesium transporter CorA family protein [Dehalococcoidia bacterium]